MFVVIAGSIFGLLGTMISLRLTWIDKLEGNNNLTRRGRLAFAVVIGLAVAVFIIVVDGMWWNCDDSVCRYVWKI